MASLRALGTRELPPLMAVSVMKELGQPVWMPPSPSGWEDDTASWAGPDALYRRVEAAQRMATHAGDAADARALAPRLLGGRLSDKTKTAIARSESPATGLALLLASPEMLRR